VHQQEFLAGRSSLLGLIAGTYHSTRPSAAGSAPEVGVVRSRDPCSCTFAQVWFCVVFMSLSVAAVLQLWSASSTRWPVSARKAVAV